MANSCTIMDNSCSSSPVRSAQFSLSVVIQFKSKSIFEAAMCLDSASMNLWEPGAVCPSGPILHGGKKNGKKYQGTKE